MPEASPLPLPELQHGLIAPLWRAASQGEFRLPRCISCGAFDWYPKGECAQCHSLDIDWCKLSGRGSLFSWAIVRRALHRPLAPLTPYISAIIVIAEDRVTRFVTRLIDCEPAELYAGMPVEVRFADLGYQATATGIIAPLFTKTDTTGRDEV